MAEPSLDILADLGDPGRHAGPPCKILALRHDRPDLAEQFDRAIEAKRTGALERSHGDIAAWFTERGVEMGTALISRHIHYRCITCKRTAT